MRRAAEGRSEMGVRVLLFAFLGGRFGGRCGWWMHGCRRGKGCHGGRTSLRGEACVNVRPEDRSALRTAAL